MPYSCLIPCFSIYCLIISIGAPLLPQFLRTLGNFFFISLDEALLTEVYSTRQIYRDYNIVYKLDAANHIIIQDKLL